MTIKTAWLIAIVVLVIIGLVSVLLWSMGYGNEAVPIQDAEILGRSFSTEASNPIVVYDEWMLYWDDPLLPTRWESVSVDWREIDSVTSVTVTSLPDGATFVFTGTEFFEIPMPEYRLVCEYEARRHDEILARETVTHDIAPLTVMLDDNTGHDPRFVPGTGQYGDALLSTFEFYGGAASIWRRCCWQAGDPWPEHCIIYSGEVPDARGFYLLQGHEYHVYMPVLSRNRDASPTVLQARDMMR